VSEDLVEQWEPVASAVDGAVPAARPGRWFTSKTDRWHLSGLRRSATTDAHVGDESWVEGDYVMMVEIDPEVVGMRRSRSGCRGRVGRARDARPGFLRAPHGPVGGGDRHSTCAATRAQARRRSDEASMVIIQDQLARLGDSSLSDEDEKQAWETIKRRAGGPIKSSAVERVVEGVVSAAIRHQLGL
jgi:hypothetical protein